MTPAPPHLEKQYIITESQIKKWESVRVMPIMASEMRSRPHTPTQSERDKAFREGFDEGFEIGKAQCETHHQEMIDEAIRATHTPTEVHR